MSDIDRLYECLQPYNADYELYRFGINSDGGYITPKQAVLDADVFYTYGVGGDISFELDVHKTRPASNYYLFDPTIDNIPTAPPQFIFTKEGLGPQDNAPYFTYESHIKRFNNEDKKVFLKIDIEGGEYGAVDIINNKLQENITALIIEVHNLNNQTERIKYCNLFDTLSNNFNLCHLHLNNHGGYHKIGEHVIIPAIELAFINKKLYPGVYRPTNLNYPIPNLDYPNNTNIRDINLTFIKHI